MNSTSSGNWAAQAVAFALTWARIPATVADPTGGRSREVRVEFTTCRCCPGILCLEVDGDDVIVWEQRDDNGCVRGRGEWPAPRPGRDRTSGIVRLVRAWLEGRSAIPGHPGPRSARQVIVDDVSTWTTPLWPLIALYLQDVADGRITPTGDLAAMEREFKALHPDYTGPYEGRSWADAVEAVHGLAHGWVVDLDSRDDQGQYNRPGGWTLQGCTPQEIENVRTAFGGDVTAVARALG